MWATERVFFFFVFWKREKFLASTEYFKTVIYFLCGPEELSQHSDLLQFGRSGDRIPVEARFSAPVQNDPEVHPGSCTVGTGSFPGVKRPGRVVDYPSPYSAEIKERVEL